MREVKLSRFSSRLTVLSMGVAAVLGAQVANAATSADMPSTTLQTITVTANSSVREKAQEGSVYTEDYTPAQQASHLSDFLNVVPGVTVGGTSAINQRIRIRGLEDSNLKVTIDGARQEGKLFYHMGDLTLDPDLLKQADVSVGNNSVTLGNDAIGGAVAFKTVDAADLLKPGQKIGAKVHAGYASNNDELLTSATVFAAPTDNIDLLAYYGKRDTNSGEDGNGRELFEDSKTESILLKAGAYIADDHHIGANFSSTEKTGIFPFRPDFPRLPNDKGPDVIPQQVKRDTYGIDYKFNPSNPLIDIDANVYQTKTKILRDSNYVGSFDFNAEVQTTGAKIQNTSNIATNVGSHKLISGVEHYKKESEMERDFVKKGTDQATNTSVYLEDQWTNGKFSLTPGVRYDRYKSPDFIAGGKTYDNVVGALAASYEIAPLTQVFASYTQLFNGPDLSQTIFNSDGDKTYVNNNLKAEEGSNAEVGIVKTLRDLTVAGDTLQLSGKYFETDIENYIEFVRSGGTRPGLNCESGTPFQTYDKADDGNRCQGTVNSTEDFKIKGIELAADYKMNDFSMGLSYSRARSKGENTGYSIPSVTGSSSESGDKYMVNLAYSPTETTDIGWRSTYVASVMPNTGANEIEKPSYDVHDIFMNYSPRQIEGLKATVGVYNLFDEAYASHSSRLDPLKDDSTDFEKGRNIKASLTYQF